MKQRVSITLEEETITKIRAKMREGWFRNKSHFIEYAIIEQLNKNANSDSTELSVDFVKGDKE